MSALSTDAGGAGGLPFAPRDWVASRGDHQRVARVKGVHAEGGRIFLDLVLYAHDGCLIGRASHSKGGPRSYEPWCPSANWERISRPDFPLKPSVVTGEDGRERVRFKAGDRLPPADYRPGMRKASTAPGALRRARNPIEEALQQIAEGHADPQALAKQALGMP